MSRLNHLNRKNPNHAKIIHLSSFQRLTFHIQWLVQQCVEEFISLYLWGMVLGLWKSEAYFRKQINKYLNIGLRRCWRVRSVCILRSVPRRGPFFCMYSQFPASKWRSIGLGDKRKPHVYKCMSLVEDTS